MIKPTASCRLLWIDEINPPGRHFRVVRSVAEYDPKTPFHDHDFVEMSWIEEGLVSHQFGSSEFQVGPGTLVFLRPDDHHRFIAKEPATIVSCAFQVDDAARLKRDYGHLCPQWPWRPEGPPLHLSVAAAVQNELSDCALSIGRKTRQDRIDLDWFITTLLRRLRDATHHATPPLPTWLAEAIDALRLGPMVAGGVPTLVKFCGRSRLHVSRSVRRHLGCSITTLMHRLRAERAARLLHYTSDTLPDIARQIGMPSQSHFHAMFRKIYGITPHRFRTTCQAKDAAVAHPELEVGQRPAGNSPRQ